MVDEPGEALFQRPLNAADPPPPWLREPVPFNVQQVPVLAGLRWKHGWQVIPAQVLSIGPGVFYVTWHPAPIRSAQRSTWLPQKHVMPALCLNPDGTIQPDRMGRGWAD